MTEDKKGTEYMVLLASEDLVHYESLGLVTANNDIGAIKVILGQEPQAGTYVAVPRRSFRERQVAVLSVTQTQIG